MLVAYHASLIAIARPLSIVVGSAAMN
jgi:hypothetical protein